MTVEADIFNALKAITANRAYPDVAPVGAARPYLTYQQVGGDAVNFLEGANPGKRNGRFQVNAWADTRAAAASIARQAEDAMRTAFKCEVLGGLVSVFEQDTKLYGTRQDFSVWFID